MSDASPASVYGRIGGKPASPVAKSASAQITAGDQSSRMALKSSVAPSQQATPASATAIFSQSVPTPKLGPEYLLPGKPRLYV